MDKPSKFAEKKKRKERQTSAIMTAVAIIVAVSFLLLLALIIYRVVVPTLKADPSEPSAETEIEPMPYEIDGFTRLTDVPATTINSSLRLLYAGSYTGAYVEDGTDETAENVMALIVENIGSDIIEYARVELQCGEDTLCFDISGLPATGKCFVLAKERAAYSADMTVSEVTCSQLALLGDRAVLDFSGEFALYPSDGVLNLQNISGKEMNSEVYLCYKNYRDGLFWGGITYRAAFGSFAVDEIVQSIQPHYTEDASVILYMFYEQ